MPATRSTPHTARPASVPWAQRTWVQRLSAGAFLLAAAAAARLLLHLGRGLTFFYDEWDWIFDRRTGGADSFLQNHNGHLHLLPIVVYRFLFATVGLGTYLPYRSAVIVVHLACAVAVFAYCRRRVAPPFALAAAVVVLFLGTAWQNLLWPFQIGFLGSVLCGILALLLLGDRPGRPDRLVAVMLLGAVASSGIGVPVLLAVAAELGVRRDWRRLASVVGTPLVAYGTWSLTYGSSQVHRSNIGLTPRYMFDAAAGAAAGLGNLSLWTGRVLVVALAAAIVASVALQRRFPPRVLALLVASSSYWGLTALSRGDVGEPAASRYVYFGGVVLLLLVVELVRRWGTSTVANLTAVLVAVALGWSNLEILRAGASGLREASSFVRAELATVELLGDRAPAEFQPDPQRMPQVTTGEYLEAIRDLGSSADTVTDLRRRPAPVRAAADGVLIRALGPLTDANAAEGSACRVVAQPGPFEIQVPPDGIVLVARTAAVDVGLRRFGVDYTAVAPVASGRVVRLRLAEDAAPDPWTVRLGSPAAFEVCAPAVSVGLAGASGID